MELQFFTSPCPCGKAHSLHVQKIVLEEGALQSLPSLVSSYLSTPDAPVCMVCDENTFAAAGKKVTTLLPQVQQQVILSPDHLHADENAVAKLEAQISPGTALLLAVGAGTIHDITRYYAQQHNIDFISVPTAASVDGFVSTVAAMTMYGFKVTYPARSPIAVVADSTVFSVAPKRLTAAGLADLLGKYTALIDWKVGNLLTDEYYCERVVEMELEAIQVVRENLEEILSGDAKANEALMQALLLSGLAMQMVGNSRPASGAEHHLSHLWEMHLINSPIDALHGEKVGVGLAIACDRYRELLTVPNAEKQLKAYHGLPLALLKERFGEQFDAILEENTPDPLESISDEQIIERFEELKELVSTLPTGDEIRALLRRAHAPATMEDLSLNPALCDLSCCISPYIRKRLTLMRVLKRFGLN